MGSGSTAPLTWAVAVRLGRISNLPTVWSNVLAGVALAGGALWSTQVLVLVIAMSLLYTAGMYLNDAFDHEIDARERPERPIPSGAISVRTVFTAGLVMLGSGLLLFAWLGAETGGAAGWRAFIAGLLLCAAIVLYDWRHKSNPVSPLLMGLCRMLVYLTAGFTITADPPAAVFYGAAVLVGWLIGLTYIAKQETLGRIENLWPLLFLAAPIAYGPVSGFGNPSGLAIWIVLVAWTLFSLFFVVRRRAGDVPRAVVSLIAGISLVDALFIAGVGHAAGAAAALGAFGLTLMLQRFVAGT